jgi:DNA-binding transcriptional LysR family regulator
MQFLHHLARPMVTQLLSFLAAIEEGSLHRAAARLRISQSALSRQMQALEHELGGRLLERTSTGVKPTRGGHALAAKMGPILSNFEAGMAEVSRLLRGEGEQLRIGYLASAGREYLSAAMKALHQSHPKVKVKLLDLSPGEQITALRRGEIDVALIDHGGDLLARDFYTRKVAVIPILAVLPAGHVLASRKEVRIADLKDETFVYAPDSEVPGYARRVIQLCRKCGKFRPRFIGPSNSLSHGLEMVVNESAVALMPAYARHQVTPCLTMLPIADPEAVWDLFIVWQRGKTAGPLRTFLDALPAVKPVAAGGSVLRKKDAA